MKQTGLSRRELLAVSIGTLVPVAGRADEEAETTPADIEGPYYKTGAPFRKRLCERDEPGEPLVVSGIVRGPGRVPLANAVVDVWQCDSHGVYDNDDPATDPHPYHLRGKFKTDAQGRYTFATVMPKPYKVSEEHTRPAHIHFKVSAEGHELLTTQLYFEGDPFLKDEPVKKVLIKKAVRHSDAEETRKQGLHKPFAAVTFHIGLRKTA